MAWIKGSRYYQHAYRIGPLVRTHYFGAAAVWDGSLVKAHADECEALVRERREWRAARRAERLAAAVEFVRVRDRLELVDAIATACLAAVGYHRPKRYRWRARRMIQIERDNSDLKREARELVKAIYAATDSEAPRPLMARLKEVTRLSPAAVVAATSGDLFRFSMGLITHALTMNPKAASGRRWGSVLRPSSWKCSPA